MLRLRNVHPELNGMDLSDLLSNVAPVDFVKFDPRDESISYICFQNNQHENNARAISRFDGKKAMGNTLVVETATSLADRIAPSAERDSFRPSNPRSRENARARESARPGEAHRARAKAKQTKERKPRPVKKTAEDLDAELSAYMNGGAEPASSAPVSTEPQATELQNAEPQPAFTAQDNGESMME